MESHPLPTKTRYDDLVGARSVFRDEHLGTLATESAGVDLSRYQPIALRLYADRESILTLYAIDQQHASSSHWEGKMPVKKFKVTISLAELFDCFRQFNFTLLVGECKAEDFEVTE